jgi:hypothetical protein
MSCVASANPELHGRILRAVDRGVERLANA